MNVLLLCGEWKNDVYYCGLLVSQRCFPASVTSYQPTPCNIPQDLRAQGHCDGSLTSHIYLSFSSKIAMIFMCVCKHACFDYFCVFCLLLAQIIGIVP